MAPVLVTLSRLTAPGARAEHGDIGEAREALAYWSRRAETLPWHRRAARREARELAAAWRARLVAAHLDRWGLGAAGRALAPLADTRGRTPAGHVRRLAWVSLRRTAIGRRVLAVTVSLTALCLAGALACLVLVAQALAG
jgi:hypothetical protein